MTNFITSIAARETTATKRVFQKFAEPVAMIVVTIFVLGGMVTAISPILIA